MELLKSHGLPFGVSTCYTSANVDAVSSEEYFCLLYTSMSERFVRQLEELHVELITMGSLCEKAISLSAKAIQGEGGMTLIGKIFETEKEIDAQEKEIENLCMKLLLHEHPVAGDLRSITAALKMISDMERIGDQAADIADLSKHCLLYTSRCV